MSRHSLITLVVVMTVLIAPGCQWVQDLRPPPPPSPTVKAPEGARVYVIDRDTRVMALSIDDNFKVAAQFPVEQGAGYVAVSPDNLLLYATAREKDYLRVFQTSGEPVGRIQTGKGPSGLGVTRDGGTALVADRSDNTISILDLKARRRIKAIPTGKRPTVLALAPDDSRFYVLLHEENEVVAYDTKTGTELARRKVLVPSGLAVDPEGKYVYVTSYDASEVFVLEPEKLAEVARVKVADGPFEVVATRDGFVYTGCVEDNSIVQFKRGNWSAEAKATPIGARPYGMGPSPDEKTLFVALEGDARLAVRSLPDLQEKVAPLELGIVPVDVFTGR